MEFLVAGSATSTVRVGVCTLAGVGRDVNQDAVLAGPTWFVVADGVGGHGAGDVASASAIEALAGRPRPASVDELRRALDDVNATIHDRSRRDVVNRMATTVVGIVVIDGAVHVFHLGDSRCYRFADGEFDQLTRDHSYVQELVDAGLLTVDAARSHRRRNVITRALGVDAVARTEIDTVAPGACRLLLCSDGVSSVVTFGEIARVLADSSDPQAAADELVDVAVAAGSRDDATALVVDGLGAI